MNTCRGDLQLILGTMFSGKTTYILSEMSKLSEAGYNILYVNTDFDTRSSEAFSTHNPFFTMGDIPRNVYMTKTRTLLELDVDKYDIIAIDESHFFDDLLAFVDRTLLSNKSLIVAGLIADYRGQKFGQILDLVPICTDIIRLKAYCSVCAKSRVCTVASHSKRIVDSTEITDIGGASKYIPVCRAHYYTNTD